MSSAFTGEGRTDARDADGTSETARLRRDLTVVDQTADLARNQAVSGTRRPARGFAGAPDRRRRYRDTRLVPTAGLQFVATRRAPVGAHTGS